MTGADSFLATGYREVDASSDIGKLAGCLRFIEALPSVIAYKRRSLEMMHLQPAQTAVDLGCGLGYDVPKLAARVVPGGQALGIDSSKNFLHAAHQAFAAAPGAGFSCGDIHHLPFAANTIDAIRIDRTLQHVANPPLVIAEMARVLKPGGWLVCAEPDWHTFVIDSDDEETTGMVVKRWRNSFRNPGIGRQLLRRIRHAGLKHTWEEGFILLADGLKSVNRVYDLDKTAKILAAESDAAAARFARWLHGLVEADKQIPVTASVTLFLAGGQKL